MCQLLQSNACIENAYTYSSKHCNVPWRRGLVVQSKPATEKTGALGREIKSC
jgi:hypothetical protein